MTTTFWILISLIIYCYFGYPALLFAIARIFPNRVRKAEYLLPVAVILSVCNEEDVIESKIKNLLSLDYPADKMEIIIGSDGSTDRTNAIVKNFNDSRIHLIESDVRRGKISTLNDIVRQAKHEILVFTDARQIFEKDAIRELVGNFTDPKVGCVSGELMFSKETGTTGKGINLYWNYEKFIRKTESQVHSMIGATGAIYAIRRELYTPAPVQTVLDDVYIPLKIVQKGYRVIFDETARAYDQVAESPREEYRRKTRTLYGNYQIFFMFPSLFIPLLSPMAIQFFSHKLLRVLIPFFLIAAFFINALLISEDFYFLMFCLQMTFYLMAMIGALLRYEKHGILGGISRACSIPYVFCLLNFSALAGFFRFINAKQGVTWEKARKQ